MMEGVPHGRGRYVMLSTTLTGYLTGAMDPDEAQVLEAQAAVDPDLSARIETQRAQADDEAPRRGRPPKRSPALDHDCPKGHAGLNAPCKVLTDGRDWFCAARLGPVAGGYRVWRDRGDEPGSEAGSRMIRLSHAPLLRDLVERVIS